MPIDVKIHYDDWKEPRDVDYISPGYSNVYGETSNTDKELISVFCLPDDEGGKVYRFRIEEYIDPSELNAISPYAFPKENLLAEIAPGDIYQCDLRITATDKTVRFILTHIKESDA